MKKTIDDLRFTIYDWFVRQLSIVNRQFMPICVIIVLLFAMGCHPPVRYQPAPLCPGKATAAEVVSVLRAKQIAPLSLKCSVDCTLEWIDSESKPKNENIVGTMHFVDPDNLRITGDKFGPISIGINPEEFWMYFKPALDTAKYGLRKDTLNCGEKSGFNPASMVYLTEAFGRIDLNADWTLTNDPGYDLLTTVNGHGVKRVYINCCTNQIERIEYCDQVRNQVILIASVDLSDYKIVDGVGEVPTTIQLRHFRFGQSDMMFQLELSAMKQFIPTPVQQEKLFVRPEPKGYKEVYRLNEQCDFVRE